MDKDPINWDEVSPEDCVYDGRVWPEHDYDEYECRRCGAEAPVEIDDDDDWEDISKALTLNVEREGDRAYWDDGPSWPLCEAMDQIVVMYLKEFGRMPSRVEIMYGVEGSMDVMNLSELPRDARRATAKQRLEAIAVVQLTKSGTDRVGMENRRHALLVELEAEEKS